MEQRRAGLGAFQNGPLLRGDGIPLTIHSTAVWLLAELGIAGFLAFAIPALFVFVTEWRRARTDQASALIVLCFVAFAVMSGPGDMLYQRTFWFVVGAVLGWVLHLRGWLRGSLVAAAVPLVAVGVGWALLID